MDRDDDGRLWRVGELARASGLSVRALHHYEHIGLLSAHGRTSGGHRLYDAEDVRRLYQIRALRDLGLSLADVAASLQGSVSVETVLKTHLQHVECQLEHLTSLRDGLAAACAQAEVLPSTASLLAAVQAMSVVAGHAGNRPSTNSHADWESLGRQLRTLRDAGEHPSATAVTELARAAQNLINRFAGDDPAVLDALAVLRRSAPQLDAVGWDQALIEFLDEALTALEPEEDAQ